MPHCLEILEKIETHRLEEWDEDLAVKGMLTVWKQFSTRSEEMYAAKAKDILNRIASLDPAAAMTVSES